MDFVIPQAWSLIQQLGILNKEMRKQYIMILTCNNRWLYWTDYGTDTIERASMDGRSRMVLHRTNLRDTYCITMDYENQVLYWADFTLNKIESSNIDGSSRRTLTTSVRDPYSMAYYNGRLYWGDNSFNRVLTGTVTSPGGGTFLGGGVSYDVYGIHIVSRETQPLGLHITIDTY